MNAKISVFVICAEVIIYLLLYSLHGCNSNIFLTKHIIEILKPGLSFTPTLKQNISELETDIYNFMRK